MNVSGVGATPPPPPLPPVGPVVAAGSSEPSNGRASGDPRAGRTRQEDRRGPDAERPAPPPLRMLTVTEMRIMLGQLPVSAALKPERHPADPTAAA